MIEDKLDHDERLRLECLAQAIHSGIANGLPYNVVTHENIVARARKFEEYVRGNND